MALCASSMLLWASPLTVPGVIFGFTQLMLTQLITMQVDLKLVEKEMAPRWFLRFRTVNFSIYMIITVALFAVFYGRMQQCQKAEDFSRITNLKKVMELDDAQFI
jgi:hypothetical protein